AVRTDNAFLFLTNDVFINNTATDGGGAVAISQRKSFAVDDVFTNVSFSGNYAGGQGGAVFREQPDDKPTIFSRIQFVGCSFDSNVSIGGAGAAHGDDVEFNFNGVSVTNNRGAIGGVVASIVLANRILFQSNVSTGDGPGAVLADGNMLRLDNSTITQNSSGAAGPVVGQGAGRAAELCNPP